MTRVTPRRLTPYNISRAVGARRRLEVTMRRVVLLLCLLPLFGAACAKKKTPASPSASPSRPAAGDQNNLPGSQSPDGGLGASGVEPAPTQEADFGPIYFGF